MPGLTRDDLLAGELIWLLTVTFAGKEYRFSSIPCCPVDSEGLAYPFDGGLEDPGFEDDLSILTDSPELRSVSISVPFPDDIAELVSQGHDLATGSAELALWVEGTTYEKRRVVISGKLSEPEYGASDELVSFSVQEEGYEDSALIPDSAAIVSLTTWPNRDDSAEGLSYPIVFGFPGHVTGRTAVTYDIPGTPGLLVDTVRVNADTGVAGRWVMIAGHPVVATSVTIWDSAGSYGSYHVYPWVDALLRDVALVDVLNPISGSVSATETDYWVTWPNAGGLRAPDGATLSGSGSVLAWMLAQSSLRVDWSRTRVAASWLDARFSIAGYIDEKCSPWDWIRDNLLPILPVSVIGGPEGLYPAIWRFDAGASEAIERLTAEAGIIRTSPVSYDTDSSSVVNRCMVSFGVNGEAGEALRSVTVLSDPDVTDADQHGDSYSRISVSRYGERAEELEAGIIYSEQTAIRIAQWRVRSQAFPRRVVSYSVPQDYLWLVPGDIVTLTDSDIHMADQVCLIRSVGLSDSGQIKLTLLIIEDPTRDEPGPTY